MKDPRLFIILEGYQILDWSEFDEDRKHVFELVSNNYKVTMTYDEANDIMNFKGEYIYLHWWLKALCNTYDLMIR